MILATICARGGSKGLPNKNLKSLLGKPLIAHSIAQAKESGVFDHIAVSSDSDEILYAANVHGADSCIKRPAELATDESGKVPAIAHAVLWTENWMRKKFDIVVDLDATSPLRLPGDIINCVELLEKTNCTNVITGTQAHRSPYFNLVEEVDGVVKLSKHSEIVCRQECPPCFDMNASIYVWNRDKFLADPKLFYPDTKLYKMPRQRSVDIDDAFDFEIVEMLMKNQRAIASFEGFYI